MKRITMNPENLLLIRFYRFVVIILYGHAYAPLRVFVLTWDISNCIIDNNGPQMSVTLIDVKAADSCFSKQAMSQYNTNNDYRKKYYWECLLLILI